MRRAARHLACLVLLLASMGAAQAQPGAPTTAGGRFIHTLLWQKTVAEAPQLPLRAAAPSTEAASGLSPNQQVVAARVHTPHPSVLATLHTHSVTATR